MDQAHQEPIKPSFQPAFVAGNVFIAPNATVRGEVRIGAGSSVWFGAVIRGDTAEVSIGADTNIQDLCVLHADPGYPCRLSDRVTVGHAAIVHGALVASDVMIGIRAVVLNGAEIGPGCLIAAGALVPEGAKIPPNSVVMGIPGKIVRLATDSDRERIHQAAEHYKWAAVCYRLEKER